MKIYLSGKICLISMVATLVAWLQKSEGFDHLYPILFWGVQSLFAIIIIVTLVAVLNHWDKEYDVPKKRVILSVINILAFYLIAWTNSQYSWFLILVYGTTEIYSLRQYLQKG